MTITAREAPDLLSGKNQLSHNFCWVPEVKIKHGSKISSSINQIDFIILVTSFSPDDACSDEWFIWPFLSNFLLQTPTDVLENPGERKF